jgi:acyl dehydratase
MGINFDLAGKVYDTVRTTPTAAQIEAYARAAGDDNPRYAAGPRQVAPPVFAVVPAFPSLIGGPVADPDLGLDDPLAILHGEQAFVFHRPLRPGEELTLAPALERVEDKGRHALFVTRVAIGHRGEPVADLAATIVVRGGGSGRPRPPSEPTAPAVDRRHRFDVASRVDEDMPQRYAAASGDHNPIHLDDGVARAVGLPGRINHGLGTLALVAGPLLDRLAGGDPERLRAMRVRFTGMVFPGDDLTTSVWSGAAVEFETRRDDGSTVMSGTMEVEGG